MTDDSKDPDHADGRDQAPYTAVVYFHGMGSQRRYEETSRLIDRLDTYLGRQAKLGNKLGILANIKARVEPDRCRANSEEIVGYIRTVHADSPAMDNAYVVRFYETYWAPIMAEQKSAWEIAKWMFVQPLRPWTTVRAPWRERQRLRRATLARIFEDQRGIPPGTTRDDYATLMSLYDEFEGQDALRRYSEGGFNEFLVFLGEEIAARIAANPTYPGSKDRCEALAKAWFAAYWLEELRNAFVLVTLALLVVLLAGGVLVGILGALQILVGFTPLTDLLARFQITLKADWATISAIAVSLVGLVGLTRFLTDYLGDVHVWATYEETDSKYEARNKVLTRSLDLLTHVLNDPRCKRVTVVAHSLGTSVAHDALLALTRRNRAANAQDPMKGPVELHKIEHFVTMGSPIDKIEYLFESYASASHRFKRVVETFRGDIGTAPFSRNRKPHVHWINFWDRGDAISGPLHSPSSARVSAQRVDNVHVANFTFPDPGASHGGYFDNKTVIQTLYQVIYKRALSFRTLKPVVPGQPPDYASVFMYPGEAELGRVALLVLALLAPWIALVAVIAGLVGNSALATNAAVLAGGIGVVIVLSMLAGKLKGQRTPL